MVILAAVCIVAVLVVATTRATDFGIEFKNAVCRVFTLGQGDCDVPTSAERIPTEPCVTKQTGWAANVKVTAGVSAGRNISVKTEELSNGQYRVTVLDGGSVGVEAGAPGGWDARIEANGTRWGSDLNAQASAQVEGTVSQSYVVNSKEEAESIEKWGIYEHAKNATVGGNPVTGFLLGGISDKLAETLGLSKPPEPTSTVYTGGASAEASAVITAWVGGAEAEVGFGASVGYTDNKDGSKSISYQIEGTAQASGAISVEAGQFGGTATAVAEDNFDKDGNRTSTTLRVGTEGADGYTITSYTLPVNSDADDQVAQDMIDNPFKIDDFIDKTKEVGEVSKVQYDSTNSNDVEAALGGDFLAHVGVELSGGTTDIRTETAEYWDGTDWQTWEGCTA